MKSGKNLHILTVVALHEKPNFSLAEYLISVVFINLSGSVLSNSQFFVILLVVKGKLNKKINILM